MSRVCAAGLSLLAFSCALIIGLCVGNPFVSVVGRALQIMLVFYVLGLVLGLLGEKAVKENFDKEADVIRQKMRPAEAAAVQNSAAGPTDSGAPADSMKNTPAQTAAVGST